MRTTLVLTVDETLGEFLENQQGLSDPSALVNKLLHEAMQNEVQPAVQASDRGLPAHDDVDVALEEHLDENTHSG